jgi:5-methylcytosine-specific restriction protein A
MKSTDGYRDITQRWYHSAKWQRRKANQLRKHPLCVMCENAGGIAPATVVDHVVPHQGDINKFWLGSLQSLCLDHHNKTKQQIEQRGYASDIGADGFPSDPDHPFNIASRNRTST